MLELSIIVPVHNEQGSIGELKKRISDALGNSINYELIFIDDGSQDESLSIIKSLSKEDNTIKYVKLSRNFGHQNAICAGLDRARGKYIVIMDSDLQDPPELVPKLLGKIKEGYNVVYAKRISRKGESWLKRFTAATFYKVLNRISDINLPRNVGDFRIIDQKVLKVIRDMPERRKFLRGQIAWIGLKQSFVEFDREGRTSGKTSYSFTKMANLAINGVVSLSEFPLKLVSYLGFSVSLISVLVIIYALIQHLVFENTISGWTSVIVSVLFIGGVQLLSIGVIGAYLARINDNTRGRPLYIVEEESLSEFEGRNSK
jgi:dolichol-phosphate mannosyltransferase